MERISYLKIGAASYGGVVQDTVEHTLNTQLKDRALWKQFVEVFRIKTPLAEKTGGRTSQTFPFGSIKNKNKKILPNSWKNFFIRLY